MNISGAGCCLIDSIYMHCSYDDPTFASLWSRKRGDGGLIEGGLVFSEDLERFAQKPYREILESLTGGHDPHVVNLGGPAVVALIGAAQILARDGVPVSFYGAVGNDRLADTVRSTLAATPLHYQLNTIEGAPTATTEVFDDPSKRAGKGERSFINTIGAAGHFGPEDIPQEFYQADIVLLGGTALVPQLHDGLHTVLARAKDHGCITVVGTVYDFRNEKKNPDKRWPLGDHSAYRNIDLLITDEEEALKLTGTSDVMLAAQELISYGLGALIITRGALDMIVWSSGAIIEKTPVDTRPVSAYMDELMFEDPSIRKDTTGCGDNFVGGVLASLAKQLGQKETGSVSMNEICAWGAASGGFTCTYHGGTYHEKQIGEKANCLEPVVRDYLQRMERG